jgi:hypothetical protein
MPTEGQKGGSPSVYRRVSRGGGTEGLPSHISARGCVHPCPHGGYRGVGGPSRPSRSGVHPCSHWRTQKAPSLSLQEGVPFLTQAVAGVPFEKCSQQTLSLSAEELRHPQLGSERESGK